jgi:phosphoglycolate phosphatase
MLLTLLEMLNVAPERALMVGDTTHDMQMARSAGVERLAIGHGAHDPADLLQYAPVASVRDCLELRAWLREHA